MSPLADRLSALPDDLLVHILHLLPSTKQRASTSVLSRRWRHLWTRVPSLDLSSRDFYFSPGYHELVNHLLGLHRATDPLHRFSADIQYLPDHDDPRSVTRVASAWIRFAAQRSVWELSLRAYPRVSPSHSRPHAMKLPRTLVSCGPSLQVLQLRRCNLYLLPNRPASLPRFPQLRTLVLNRVRVSQARLRALLGMCPALENLTFSKWDTREPPLELCSSDCPQLRTLVFEGRFKRLVIDLPSFSRLRLRIFDFFVDLQVKDVSNLNDLALESGDLGIDCGFEVAPFVSALSAVEDMSLDAGLFEIVELKEVDFTCMNLRVLRWHELCLCSRFLPLFFFLKRCPSLEKLIITFNHYVAKWIKYVDKCFKPELAEDHRCDLHDSCRPSRESDLFSVSAPTVLASCRCRRTLKSIIFYMFADEEEMMLLVKLLLATMATLEQLTVVFGSTCFECVDMPKEKIMQEINRFYKRSPTVRIVSETM